MKLPNGSAGIFLFIFLFINSMAEAKYNGKHEWRAVWIATVDNTDWPSKPGLTSQQQQDELIAYLDLFKKMNFNAIVLQIRPTSDAFYYSKNEPWSIYLTGDQALAPNPEYDPLAFAVEEAHKRGMELHAWVNPYRVSQNISNIEKMAETHYYKKKPEIFQIYGRKLFFDPGYPETREFLVMVIKDIVTRYDVDGIHFDDYFYPYSDFNDTVSFAKHSRGYKPEDKMAWRRENVDLVVKMVIDAIKSVKPYVKFGISPYAVWRNLSEDPRGSNTKSYSYSNFDHLHADILLWLKNGWIDYIVPQLYFHVGYKNADFRVLAKWWGDNSGGIPVYAGIGTFRLNNKSKIKEWRTSNEIRKQLGIIRKSKGYRGVCYFNAKNMLDNNLDINLVLTSLYRNPALVPPMKGFSKTRPRLPLKAEVTRTGKVLTFTWADLLPEVSVKENLPVYYHAIYKFPKGRKPDFTRGDAIVALTGEDSFSLPVEKNFVYEFYLTSLDRLYNESGPVKFIYSAE